MNYHNIERGSIVNGDGIRVVLWVSGCTHNCKNCQNPQTHDPESGIPFDSAAKEELFSILKDKYISGITFSGGDPLHPSNIAKVVSLILEIRETFPEKTIWVYTGRCIEDLIYNASIVGEYGRLDRLILENIDVLVDGPYIEELSSVEYHWAGSTNQRVIDMKKTLKTGTIYLHK